MAITEQIQKDMVEAMRKRDELRLSTLRMVKSALENKRVEKRAPLDDKESQQVLSTLIKQRRDSIEQFAKAGRKDLVDKETAEIGVLETYLPPALDSATLDKAVVDAIAETGATSAKDMGRVMKTVMSKFAGQTVDGKAVNELVRRKLGA